MAPSTDHVFKNSIGIALSYKDALKIDNKAALGVIEQTFLAKPNHLKEQEIPRKFKMRTLSVAQDPAYKEIQEKFGRAIDSNVYKTFRQTQHKMEETMRSTGQIMSPQNVPRHTSSDLIQQLVAQTKFMQRDDHSPSEIMDKA